MSMFYFLTLYMQTILGWSPLQTGAAYLPLCFGVGIAAGVTSKLLGRTGSRPIAVAGALIAAAGLALLARLPVDGSYVTDLLPGLMIVSVGLGAVFVAITTAANAGVPPEQAGLAAALLNASQQVGSALGLAIFSAVAAGRTHHLLAQHTSAQHAVTAGFHRALLTGAGFAVVAALIALRTSNSRGETDSPVLELIPAQGASDVH
jgi:MFS family permease